MTSRIGVLALSLLPVILGAAVPANAQGNATPAAPTTPVRGALPPSNYVIGPEDLLGVVFWREPEMSGDVTVRPDGRITVPVVGEIQAAGLAPTALQEQIAAAAAKYINAPNVVVVVRAINSRKVFVTGRVTTPGAHSLIGPLTVMQAIALAGGLTEYANEKNITVLRNEKGRVVTLKFNYTDVARGRNVDQNVQLQPGDTIVVP
jgi:polysaccharide export outer membrane protein